LLLFEFFCFTPFVLLRKTTKQQPFHPFSSFFILFHPFSSKKAEKGRKRQKKAEKGREGIPGQRLCFC